MPQDLYAITSSPGKGEGVFATQPIRAGALILSDTPTMIIPETDPTESSVHLAFLQLSEQDQDRFRSLHEGTRPLKTTLARIYHENCFESDKECWIGLTISKINHSCLPNAQLDRTVDDLSSSRLYACRDIAAGEEIFICYRTDVCESSPRVQRQAYLQEYWSFMCRCAACSLTGAEADLSDQRRMLARGLRWNLKYLEPFPQEQFHTLDPGVIAAQIEAQSGKYPDSRKFYDRTTLLCNILLANLLECEGLPGNGVADCLQVAAEVLLHEMNVAKEHVVLLGAARNVRDWMQKAISFSMGEEREGFEKAWRDMETDPILQIGLRVSAMAAEKAVATGAIRVEDLMQEVASVHDDRIADAKAFALRPFLFPDGTPGMRCIDETECRKFVDQQVLRPRVARKAREDIKMFAKQWRKMSQAKKVDCGATLVKRMDSGISVK